MSYRSMTMLPCLRSCRVSAPRHISMFAQRFELAALPIDIAAHVGGDGLESYVAVERQPHGIVFDGVPPKSIFPRTV
jgi:hypothetical protein